MLDKASDDLAAAIEQQRQASGLGYETFARSLAVSVGSLHSFLRPQPEQSRPRLGPSVWRALYRAYPQLRWLLEEYQRQAALSEGTPAKEPPQEVATGPPGRRS